MLCVCLCFHHVLFTLCGVKSTPHPRGKGPSLAHAAAIPLILLEQRQNFIHLYLSIFLALQNWFTGYYSIYLSADKQIQPLDFHKVIPFDSFFLTLNIFMASITTPKILQDHKNSGNDDNGYEVISRQDIQAAIAKTVELRTLHAALMQGNSPAKLRLPTVASPVFPNFTAQDYPVFTPVSIAFLPLFVFLDEIGYFDG